MERTNVMRILTQQGIPFTPHDYDSSITDGETIAKILGENPESVFKTLVTVGNNNENYVFVIPVCATLDLKKAAQAAGVKSIQMIKQKELLPLTGYIRGGCSPVGMKKTFPTYFHESCARFPYIYVSAGQRGLQFKVAPSDLVRVSRGTLCDLIAQPVEA